MSNQRIMWLCRSPFQLSSLFHLVSLWIDFTLFWRGKKNHWSTITPHRKINTRYQNIFGTTEERVVSYGNIILTWQGSSLKMECILRISFNKPLSCVLAMKHTSRGWSQADEVHEHKLTPQEINTAYKITDYCNAILRKGRKRTKDMQPTKRKYPMHREN